MPVGPDGPARHAHGHAVDHGHGHAHDHGHFERGHGHRPRQRRALLLCIVITLVTMVAEVVGGLWTESLMLLSDAVHMLSHALALGVSYVALRLAGRPSGRRAHFGFYRAEILGAFLNGLGVLVFSAWIVIEAIDRFFDPSEVMAAQMTVIATAGLVANLATAVILARAGAHDLNTKSAFLHMLGDTLSSVAILIGGALLWASGWTWIDPALSLLIAAVVAYWGLGLLRDSTGILMEAAPADIDPAEILAAVRSEVPQVLELHDLHVWEITSGYICLTAHLVVRDDLLSETGHIRDAVCSLLKERFHVGHVTLQIESASPIGASTG